MKAIITNVENLSGFNFEVLTENEMMEVRGGDGRPVTRDRDVWDEEQV